MVGAAGVAEAGAVAVAVVVAAVAADSVIFVPFSDPGPGSGFGPGSGAFNDAELVAAYGSGSVTAVILSISFPRYKSAWVAK